MKSFKDLNFEYKHQHFTGEKIKISKILNREIIVHDFKIDKSKYQDKGDKCLHLQIEYNNEKRVLFSASKYLMEALIKLNKKDFPFQTIIIEENQCFKFT